MNAKDIDTLLHHLSRIAKAAGVPLDPDCFAEIRDALGADEARIVRLERDVERLEAGTGAWRERR